MQEVSGSNPLISTRQNHPGSPSSRGLGHRPFTAATGVRIPLGMPFFKACFCGRHFPRFIFCKCRHGAKNSRAFAFWNLCYNLSAYRNRRTPSSGVRGIKNRCGFLRESVREQTELSNASRFCKQRPALRRILSAKKGKCDAIRFFIAATRDLYRR